MLPKTVMQGLADRIAAQVDLFQTAISAATVEGGGYCYPRIHAGIPATGMFDAEDDLISSANALDTSKITESATLQPYYRDFINDLNTHAANVGKTDLNTFLSGVGLNVAPDFDAAYYAVRGTHLWGENVFSDALVTLGTIALSGSGIGVFTGGTAMGSGSHAVTSATNRAAAMLHVTLVSGITATTTMLDVRLTNENDVATSKTVTIPAGTNSTVKTSVGISGTDFFRSVTNIVPAGGHNGLSFTVINQYPERVVAL